MAKEKRKTKDIGDSEEFVGTLPKNHLPNLWKQVLHLWTNWAKKAKSPVWTLVGQSQSGSVFKIRFKGAKAAMCEMQSVFGRYGGGILSAYVYPRGEEVHGKVGKRPKSKCKGNGLVSKTHPRLPKNFGKLK